MYIADCGRRSVCELPGVWVIMHGLWEAPVHMAKISATSDSPHSHLVQHCTFDSMLIRQRGAMPLGVALLHTGLMHET